MINKRPRDRRPRHRCPECHSSNIYKRTFISTLVKPAKGRYAIDIGESSSIFKKYRCINCKKEFEIAFVE